MMLSALSVVYINNEETIQNGEAAMAGAYQVFSTDGSGGFDTLVKSFANSFVMVSVICLMTFVIVLLYKFKCMKCLIGYMIFCSATLLGVLGGNLLNTGLMVYHITVDQFTYYFFVYNFCVVGVASVFWGQGIPKYVTQGYLMATAVILAWHLSYFDSWTTWSLLTMLALYDLCAVLTPCGPLRFLVDLMSKDDAPDMPGLLYEAELPPEARRPGVPRGGKGSKQTNYGGKQYGTNERGSRTTPRPSDGSDDDIVVNRNNEDATSSINSGVMEDRSEDGSGDEGPLIDIPLAVAKVYNLPVLSIPHQSLSIMSQGSGGSDGPSNSPLLASGAATSHHMIPENPSPAQLRAEVTVRLPKEGGRITRVAKRGKKVYLETDRQGKPKRILWVDRTGKVFAEMRDDDEDLTEQNSIRLGLGDFIFYSVLVAKAAQYSFATFAACILVILAGLGGTLVLLSVFHHALPALPISIFLGVVFYIVTRLFIEPWIAEVLQKPYYV
jgi:presenilin 1